jgi:hypothetical protein
VSIPCRIHGQRSLDSAPLSASVRHGDVITVTGAVALSGDGTPTIKPMVSEWRGSGGTASRPQQNISRPVSSGNQQNALPVIPSPTPPQAPAPPRMSVTPTADAADAFPAPFSIPPQAPEVRRTPAAAATPSPTPRNSESGSGSRVVIVGDRPKPTARQPQDEVLLLADSLRATAPVAASRAAANSSQTPRDHVNSKSGFAGRTVSGQHSKVPISAAVSTKKQDSGPDSANVAAVPESVTSANPVTQPQTLHWAVIIGLFIAGVWVLARSLFVGSISASAAAAAGVVRSTSENSAGEIAAASNVSQSAPVPDASENDAPWRIYSVPRGLRPANAQTSQNASTDELDLLIANRIPVERTAPQLPQSLELSGRSGSQTAGAIRRVDGPHSAVRGSHAAHQDPSPRRGRSLEERLSQLIRTVPTGSSGAER